MPDFGFFFYLNDLRNRIAESDDRAPCVGRENSPLLLNADDVVLLTE